MQFKEAMKVVIIASFLDTHLCYRGDFKKRDVHVFFLSMEKAREIGVLLFIQIVRNTIIGVSRE